MVGLSGVHVDGKPMGRQPATSRSVLAAVLRWPWVPPAAAVVVVSAAGQLGRVWWYVALGGVVVSAAAVVGGLMRRGRD